MVKRRRRRQTWRMGGVGRFVGMGSVAAEEWRSNKWIEETGEELRGCEMIDNYGAYVYIYKWRTKDRRNVNLF